MWFVSEVALLTVCSMKVMPVRGKKNITHKMWTQKLFFLTINVNPIISVTATYFSFVFLTKSSEREYY